MAELERLNAAVDEFSAAMKRRLNEKMLEGYMGWDGGHPEEDLIEQIEDDLVNIGMDADDDKKVCVDIANRAMMMFWRRNHPSPNTHHEPPALRG